MYITVYPAMATAMTNQPQKTIKKQQTTKKRRKREADEQNVLQWPCAKQYKHTLL